MRFNLSAWALQNRQIVVYLMLLLALVGALSYSKLAERGPAVHLQGHGHPDSVAWRDGRRGFTPGHRTHREEADGDRRVRAHCLLLTAGRVQRHLHGARLDALEGHPRPLYQIRKKIGDIRHTPPPGVQGPFFNDEFRHYLRQHLRADWRRVRLRDPQGLCRSHSAATAAGEERRQGRADRSAGREDLDRAFQRQAGHPRRSAGSRASGAGGPERGQRRRFRRDHQRPGAIARDW